MSFASRPSLRLGAAALGCCSLLRHRTPLLARPMSASVKEGGDPRPRSLVFATGSASMPKVDALLTYVLTRRAPRAAGCTPAPAVSASNKLCCRAAVVFPVCALASRFCCAALVLLAILACRLFAGLLPCPPPPCVLVKPYRSCLLFSGRCSTALCQPRLQQYTTPTVYVRSKFVCLLHSTQTYTLTHKFTHT